MGRGTSRRLVEGQSALECPSTALRAAPLPMSFAHREDKTLLSGNRFVLAVAAHRKQQRIARLAILEIGLRREALPLDRDQRLGDRAAERVAGTEQDDPVGRELL